MVRASECFRGRLTFNYRSLPDASGVRCGEDANSPCRTHSSRAPYAYAGAAKPWVYAIVPDHAAAILTNRPPLRRSNGSCYRSAPTVLERRRGRRVRARRPPLGGAAS